MCVSKPEVPSSTLVYIKILDIHVYTDDTSSNRTKKKEREVFIVRSGYGFIFIAMLLGSNVELMDRWMDGQELFLNENVFSTLKIPQ